MAKFIGLMSGTSVDAVDAALVDFAADSLTLVATTSLPIDQALHRQISDLFTTGPDEIERLGRLDRQLGGLFAKAAMQLLQMSGVKACDIVAIGSHGQTIRHRPRLPHQTAFTLQIGDPNTIAELTGITTVADFRRRDIACSGQGAPLTPAFHQAFFSHDSIQRAVLNLGGIANITWLPSNQTALGFDTGPANGFMDYWIQRCRGEAYDQGGAWAAGGMVQEPLLFQLLDHPFFAMPPPKSTGKEEFTPAWLEAILKSGTSVYSDQDVQATLLELTARTVTNALIAYCPSAKELFLCGGGALNGCLYQRLQALLPQVRLATTAELGIDVCWVEAIAFAWLAMRSLAGLSGNLPSVTGARHEAVLGAIYSR